MRFLQIGILAPWFWMCLLAGLAMRTNHVFFVSLLGLGVRLTRTLFFVHCARLRLGGDGFVPLLYYSIDLGQSCIGSCAYASVEARWVGFGGACRPQKKDFQTKR